MEFKKKTIGLYLINEKASIIKVSHIQPKTENKTKQRVAILKQKDHIWPKAKERLKNK